MLVNRILKNKLAFTLVELMVVVVVLGILAGIAVQRMGDVRDRSEKAAEEANIRLLLGAANLARARNYGDYMFCHEPDGDKRNGTIRWQRPCEGPAVTQWMASHARYASGYETFTDYDRDGTNRYTTLPLTPNQFWNPTQKWNLTDFLESFPIGAFFDVRK